MSRTKSLQAWSLSEGDVLLGRKTRVLLVRRDAVAGQLTVLTDDGASRTLRREDRVLIARRAVADTLTLFGWRLGRSRNRQ